MELSWNTLDQVSFSFAGFGRLASRLPEQASYWRCEWYSACPIVLGCLCSLHPRSNWQERGQDTPYEYGYAGKSFPTSFSFLFWIILLTAPQGHLPPPSVRRWFALHRWPAPDPELRENDHVSLFSVKWLKCWILREIIVYLRSVVSIVNSFPCCFLPLVSFVTGSRDHHWRWHYPLVGYCQIYGGTRRPYRADWWRQQTRKREVYFLLTGWVSI